MGSSKAAKPTAAPEVERVEPVAEATPLESITVETGTPDFAADEAELGEEPAAYRWHLSRAIYRGAGSKREWESCTSYPAGVGAITADNIREDWGAGTYYAQLRSAPGTGQAGAVRKTRLFHIATPRMTAAPTQAAAPPDLVVVLRELGEQQRAGLERLAQLLTQRPPAPSIDPAGMLDLAMKMADRMTPPRERSDGQLETVAKWFDLADRFRSGEKGWADLVAKGIDTLQPLVDVTVTRLGGEAPARENGTAAPAAAANGQTKVEAPPMLQLANYLQRQVRYLTGKAAQGSSAELYAEVVLDNLPPGVTQEQVLGALKTPGALDRLFSTLPNDDRVAAQAHRAWFETLLREMIAFLEPEGEGAGEGAAGESPPGEAV